MVELSIRQLVERKTPRSGGTTASPCIRYSRQDSPEVGIRGLVPLHRHQFVDGVWHPIADLNAVFGELGVQALVGVQGASTAKAITTARSEMIKKGVHVRCARDGPSFWLIGSEHLPFRAKNPAQWV